jgi:hypothetical protein
VNIGDWSRLSDMAKAKQAEVYIFKVALRNVKRVWRRIAIRSDQTLEKLHDAIFKAFDRYDDHLYSFYFPKPGAQGRLRLQGATEYTDPRVLEDNPFDDGSQRNAATAKIGDLKLTKGQSFDYLSDFGDSWKHEITVEETGGVVEPGRYPRILEKHGKSPPQYPDLEEDDEEE